jgi:hypothetical protein
MANLEVTVGADLTNLSKGMTEAAKAVSNFSVSAEGDILSFNKSISTLERQLKVFQTALKETLDPARAKTLNSAIEVTKNRIADINKVAGGTGFNKFTAGTKQAGAALTDLSRIAQDAPFGFIGIQNNLNPLLESFGRLKQESGSTGAALKSLAGSLIGPAGLGLALSLASSAFLFYQQSQQKAAKTTKEADDLNKQYRESLTGVSAALLKGSQDAEKETTSLTLLFTATRNVNLSIEERTKAAKILQSTYPETFKNFTTEEILLGKADTAYKNLTKSIIAQSVVKAAADKIADNSIKKLEVEGRLNQKQLEINDARVKAAKDLAAANASVGTSAGIGGASTGNINDAIKAKDAADNLSKSEKELLDIKIERFKIDKENISLNQFINKEIENQGISVLGLDDSLKKASKSAKELKRDIEPIDILTLFKSEDSDFVKFNKEVVERLAKGTDFKAPEIIVPVPLDFQLVNPEITGGFDLFLQTIQSQAETLNNQIVPFISDTFANLGQAFASGDFSQLGQGLLRSLSGFLKSLGQLMIKEGAAYIVRGIAANIALPGTGVPFLTAGKLLVAGGIAASVGSGAISGGGQGQGQQGYQIPQFANGVTNFSGGTALVGERGPELVTLPTGSNVITNENIRRYMGAGNSSSVIIPDVKIKGQDLVVVFNRADKNFNRVT